ncbi:hypothetical protein EDD68_10527 [Melghiribacillus thermohalophilus]|uniref:Uncharacterized protein n=1 Tax=Melghiribacillus thermohalophilus TaxID=1324956 RepID=A0A4R3N677_9BACI|nr:hypothetical protein [Melghiribacillus thermohalophilus]TCT24575.1 hypothetical protein EDD68_10527 [Melghiribacillus thermohalophilus]
MLIQRMILIMVAVAGFLVAAGCQQDTQAAENRGQEKIIRLEYLDPDQTYSDQIQEWLNQAIQDSNDRVHQYSSEGYEYIYAKGYTKAKAAYTYTDIGGATSSTLTITLLRGKQGDEVFARIAYDPEGCCTGMEIDITEDEPF